MTYLVKRKSLHSLNFLWYITFCDIRIWHHGVYRCVLLSADYVVKGPRGMENARRADDRRWDLMKGSNLQIHEFCIFFNNLLLTICHYFYSICQCCCFDSSVVCFYIFLVSLTKDSSSATNNINFSLFTQTIAVRKCMKHTYIWRTRQNLKSCCIRIVLEVWSSPFNDLNWVELQTNIHSSMFVYFFLRKIREGVWIKQRNFLFTVVTVW